MSETLKRQWVPVAGGSCDIRMGYGALDRASKLMADSVGNPRACMVVARSSARGDVTELLRRQLVHAGFAVSWHFVEDEDVRTIAQASRLCEALASERITGDDLCCVLGDADLVSMVSYACGSWCGGMTLVAVVEDEVALLEGVLVPRSLDVGANNRMVSVRASAQHVLLDYELCLLEQASEASLYARVLMVATAMADSERAFSELWDRAEKIADGDEEALLDQLLVTARARGQAVSSTAAAIRQAMDYGQSFANALSRTTKHAVPRSICLAEGMRFCARISVALQKLPLDDMLAQDELLQALGVGFAQCDVAPSALAEALKEEHFQRSNRLMLLVPFAIGRVRPASVPSSMLAEHAEAWCAAHKLQ